MYEDNDSAGGEHPTALAVDDLESLRLRVQRLEETVAALQNTQDLETRIVERLNQRPEPEPDPPPVASVIPPQPPPTPVVVSAPDETGWLVFDAMADLKAIWQMFFDLRYHFAWSTRLMLYILLPVVLTTHIWFVPASIPLVGGFIDKVIALVLAFFIYKALSREARRYRLFVQFNPHR